MTEKEILLKSLVEKSGKSEEDLNKIIKDKVNEMSGLVSEEGAIYIIANELGVRLDVEKPKRDLELLKIVDIIEPKTPVSLICKVIKKYDKVTFKSEKSSQGSVRSILVGDESGIIRVVFWNDQTDILDNIQEGDILKIINAYTRENTNSERIEIHYGQYSDIEVNPKGVEITLSDFKREDIKFTEKKISDFEENDRNIKISATVTDFDIPRFYYACPECFKKVFQDDGIQKCAQHGEVTAIRVPIVNLIVDDGSGTISIVAFRDRAENITTLKSDDILKLTEDIDKYRNFSKRIIGSKVDLVGNIGLNNMTGEAQFLVNQILGVEIKDVNQIAEDLIAEEKENQAQTNKTNLINNDEDDLDLDIEEIDIDDDLL